MKAAQIFDLTGQVAMVTGASSGLGVRFAKVLAANGAKVALVARRADRLAGLRAEIEHDGGSALAIEADVTDAAAMRAAFDAAERGLGLVTLLVNNAGIAPGARAIDMSLDDWRKVMALNLDAVFACSQEAARRLIAAKQPGAIINTASIISFGVSKGVAAYAVSKAGVVQVTKALALEWAPRGIRVNAIAPGWFVTDLNRDYLESAAGQALMREIPMGRFGAEGDLDGALLLLASPTGGRYMTGATVLVDGGQVIALRG